jgi:hypothetical protein
MDALAAFERSARMRSHPVTTYNVGYCERALGHFTRARKMFKQALEDHEAGNEGTLTPELLGEARSYLPEVERRLATAVVTLAPADTAVAVDGRPLEVVSGGKESAVSAGRVVLAAGTREPGRPEVPPAGAFDLLLDPGRHVFVLSRTGAADVVIEETFEAGATRPLALSAGEPTKPRASASQPAAPEMRPSEGPDYTWPIVAYSVGAAGIAVGSIFGIATLVNKGDLDEQCPTPNTCRDEAQPDIETANLNAAISTIGFGVGIAGAALGTYLLLSTDTPGERERAANRRRSVEPWLGPAAAGIRGQF